MSNSRNVRVQAVSVLSSSGERIVQEDHALAFKDQGVFVVADGFGGPVAGVSAAKTACESVHGFLVKEAGDHEATLPFVLRNYFSLAGNVLFNALVHANRQVMRENVGKNVNDKGGASVIAGFVDGSLLALANVGVCSAWLIRDGRLAELAIPRSYSRLQDPFDPDARESAAVPLMALGMVEDLEPEIIECMIRPGDWLLLQSDGVRAPLRSQFADIQLKKLIPSEALSEAGRAFKATLSGDNSSISLVIF